MSGRLPPLAAGDLRHRIDVRRLTKTSDGKGGWISSWATIAQPRAEVIGLDGRESVVALSLQGISSFRIRVRFGKDIRPADQARFAGRDLNVRSVTDPNGDREQLVILADTASTQKTT